MSLRVRVLGPRAKRIHLSKEVIQRAVESRLRSARIYDSDADNFFHVSVTVLVAETTNPTMEPIFPYFISGQFWKIMRLISRDGYQEAMVHIRDGSGLTFDRSQVLSLIAEMMDGFLVDYLRDNEKSCERRFR